jgi:coiled-coil and C2 domain-containing protein 2A
VRIVYNEDYSEVKLTNIAEGDFPEWNEILEFPLKALNKKRFTKQELMNTKTMIYITLFDRELSMYNTGRVEIEQNYRYLGSFSIPLIALLNNPPKIDAIFKVNRPLALFNYQVETNTFFFLNNEGNQIPGSKADVEKVEVPNTYISMSIALDPVLELPQDNELEYYIGLEKQNLLSAASDWLKTIKHGKFEKRNIKVYGENVSGQSVLLCRYISPQTPPPDIYDYRNANSVNDKYAIEKAARYVSLIPLIEDNQAFLGTMPDLWCTSQEFLDLGAGDVEEHAVLLCNYFNFIDNH